MAVCPSCSFEAKILAVQIEEVYKFVYDKHDFIGLRLINGQEEPDRTYIKDFLLQYAGTPTQQLILEIGPGSGRNLLYAKGEGFKTATLDVSETNNQYYSSVCNFDHIYNSFEEIQDNSVDHIFMTHVIEHVPEPLGMMSQVYRILKPGGFLLISTPSTSSLFKRLLRHNWWVYDIDDHVSFFNVHNLSHLLKHCSFEVIESRTHTTDATHALSAYVRKRRTPQGKYGQDDAYKEQSNLSSKPTKLSLKTKSVNVARSAINTIFAPSPMVGLGYEAICIARK